MRVSRQDVRLAARSLTRRPGFAVVAILSLALAIALNTTMYSVLDAMVNPEVDLPDAGQLYTLRLWGDYKGRVDNATRAQLLTSGLRSYEDVSFIQTTFRQASAVEFGTRYAQASAGTVAPNLFRTIGSRPAAGRYFTESDFTDSARPVVIGEQLAATLSPDRPFPIGERIVVDGVPRPVIGVVARKAMLPGWSGTQLWSLPPADVPLSALPINIIRLRRGANTDQVVAELDVISARLAQLAGTRAKDTRFQITPAVSGQLRMAKFHYALIGAVIALLLIACANLANLQLARGLSRGRELAVRAALGASRADIVVQLLIESGLLAASGLVAGLIATYWGVHLLASRVPPSVAEYVIAPQISWRVVVFAALTAALCTLLVGLMPAIRVSRVDPNELLKSNAGTGSHRSHRRQYGVMVAVEIGLALAVLSGAAVVMRTALRVREDADAVNDKDLSSGWIFLRGTRDSLVSTAALTSDLVNRLRSIPDVSDAAVSLSRSIAGRSITVDERDGTPHEIDAPMYSYTVVSPAELRTSNLRVVQGRDFREGVPVESEVIVDQRTARVLWPGVDPVGMQIKLGEYKSDAPWARVVGIAANRVDPLRGDRTAYRAAPVGRELGDIYYLPSAKDSVDLGRKGLFVIPVVRAVRDPARMPISMLRYLQHSPAVVFVAAGTMDEVHGVVRLRQSHDFIASIFGMFAAFALALAALGVYGVVAHSVAERTRELGVRIALGAAPRDIIRAVLRDGNPIVLAGLAAGLYCTKRSVPWLHAFSFEGDEYDVVLFASVALTLFALAFAAGLVPALRATRINPVESLRSE